jgi:hypothetical protein
MIRELRVAYRARKALNPVALYWVKGHSDITHNDRGQGGEGGRGLEQGWPDPYSHALDLGGGYGLRLV